MARAREAWSTAQWFDQTHSGSERGEQTHSGACERRPGYRASTQACRFAERCRRRAGSTPCGAARNAAPASCTAKQPPEAGVADCTAGSARRLHREAAPGGRPRRLHRWKPLQAAPRGSPRRQPLQTAPLVAPADCIVKQPRGRARGLHCEAAPADHLGRRPPQNVPSALLAGRPAGRPLPGGQSPDGCSSASNARLR